MKGSQNFNKFGSIRLDKNLIRAASGLIYDLPSPVNISYFWKFGSLLGLVLVSQMVSGLILTMSYVSSVEMAFNSMDLISRELNSGWVIRGFHVAGASMFFVFLYLHLGRNLYFFSFNLMKTWLSGVVMFILVMAMAFLGYVLPWGQMSYWGATVITKFFSVIPLVGGDLVVWIWGGFAVDYPTLTRFYSLHYLCPFILVVVIMFHLVFLHETGSNNPLGVKSSGDKVGFFPLFFLKDVFGFSLFFWMIYMFFVFPKVFMEYQNFLEAKPLVTPTHIQPEWYFLPAYAMLRSIPSKLGGVMALACFMAILFFVPLLMSLNKFYLNTRNSALSFIFQLKFWVWVMKFFMLMWVGACPVETPFLEISRVSTLLYFMFYFSLIFF